MFQKSFVFVSILKLCWTSSFLYIDKGAQINNSPFKKQIAIASKNVFHQILNCFLNPLSNPANYFLDLSARVGIALLTKLVCHDLIVF